MFESFLSSLESKNFFNSLWKSLFPQLLSILIDFYGSDYDLLFERDVKGSVDISLVQRFEGFVTVQPPIYFRRKTYVFRQRFRVVVDRLQ